MLITTAFRNPCQTTFGVRGFATRPDRQIPKTTPVSSPDSTITFKMSFDHNRTNSIKNMLCYIVPFMSRPKAIIDEKFMKTLEPTSKDSIHMVEKKKDLKQYFTSRMYSEYYTDIKSVLVGTAIKWFTVMNSINFYFNSGDESFFFGGVICNMVALYYTAFHWECLLDDHLKYGKINEYNKIKEICESELRS